MIKARTFRKRTDAEAHRQLVTERFNLPRMFSQADLDDGTIRQVGGGRHVPPEKITREPVPALHYDAAADEWAVEAGESEEADEALAAQLVTVRRRDLREPDEAPKARGGKGAKREADAVVAQAPKRR